MQSIRTMQSIRRIRTIEYRYYMWPYTINQFGFTQWIILNLIEKSNLRNEISFYVFFCVCIMLFYQFYLLMQSYENTFH